MLQKYEQNQPIIVERSQWSTFFSIFRSKISILKQDGIIDKKFYEQLTYEPVDNSSLF